jgi:CRP-like cAMP-binding protein
VDVLALNLTEIDQSPALAQSIFLHLSRRLRQTEAILALVGHRRVEDKLRSLLLLLRQEVGYPVEKGTRIGVRLTHQHLANAIGTTRVTVTRLLGKLQKEGWLNVDKSRHFVLPLQAEEAE